MALRGDLKSINLGNVLQDLAFNSQTGTLRLHVGDRRRFLWFEKGLLRLVGLGDGQGPSILTGLLALGKVKSQDLPPTPKRTGEAPAVNKLIRQRAATNADVKAALEGQMSELVCDTFLWTDAEFEFVRGEASSADFDVRQLDWEPSLACDAIIMEALRRADEWTEIKKSVISAEEILVQLVEKLPDTADALAHRLFDLLDGERRLQDIMNETHMGQFAAFRAAAALLRGGWARPLDIKEALAKAEAHAAGGRYEPAMRLLRFAISREPHSPALRKLAGKCLEALSKHEEAAAEYRVLLAEESEHGRTADAIATCRKIISLAPKDSFTQERLFQLLLQSGTPEEVLAQGETLARSLKRAGMPDRARDVYEQLVAKFEDNERLLESLAEIAHHMGDKREAVVLYRKLFDAAVDRGEEDVIVSRARTLLRLDPSLDDVARKRIEIETGMYRKNLARRRKVRLLMFGLLALAVVVGLVAVDLSARSALRRVRAESVDLVRKNKLALAAGLYNKFLDQYRWTLVHSEAKEERNVLEDRLGEEVLPQAMKLDSEGQIPAALRTIDDVLKVARSEATVLKAKELREKVDGHRREVEEKNLGEARKIAKAAKDGDLGQLEKVKAMNHPLALPALRLLLADPLPAVRKAAVGALAEVGSDETILALVEALAMEWGNAEMRGEIESRLRRAAKADHGPRPQDWEAWLVRRREGREVQGVLADGGSGEVEWRIVNWGPTDRKLDLPFGPNFKAVTAAGKDLKISASFEAPAVRRGTKATLKPGQFVGGRAALKDLVDLAGIDGPVRVSWSVRMKDANGEEWELTSLPVEVAIKK